MIESIDLPVFEAALDDLPQFFSTYISWTIDQQPLLFERAFNQSACIGISIAERCQTIRDPCVTHQREQGPWKYLRHLCRCKPVHIGSQQLGGPQVAFGTNRICPAERRRRGDDDREAMRDYRLVFRIIWG